MMRSEKGCSWGAVSISLRCPVRLRSGPCSGRLCSFTPNLVNYVFIGAGFVHRGIVMLAQVWVSTENCSWM